MPKEKTVVELKTKEIPTIKVLISRTASSGIDKYLDKQQPLKEVLYTDKKGKDVLKTRINYRQLTKEVYNSYYHQVTYKQLYFEHLVKGKAIILGNYKTKAPDIFDSEHYPVNLRAENFESIQTITLDIDDNLSLKDFNNICKEHNIEPTLLYYTLTNPYYVQDKFRALFHLPYAITDIKSYSLLYRAFGLFFNGSIDKTSNLNRIFLGTENSPQKPIYEAIEPLIHLNEHAFLSIQNLKDILSKNKSKPYLNEHEHLVIEPIIKTIPVEYTKTNKKIKDIKSIAGYNDIWDTFIRGGFKDNPDYYNYCLACSFVALKHNLIERDKLIDILNTNNNSKEWNSILNGLRIENDGFIYYDIIASQLGLIQGAFESQRAKVIKAFSFKERLKNYQGTVINLEYTDYINADLLKDTLDKYAKAGNNILLNSFTGSGKSRVINSIFKGTKAVQVKPRQSNIQQTEVEYFDHNNQYLLENVNFDKYKQGEIYTTTESLYKIDTDIDRCIVDEAHCLVSESDFRGSSIKGLYEIEKKANYNIHITATPEPMDLDYYDIIIVFTQKEEHKNKIPIDITTYKLPKYNIVAEENLKVYKQLIDNGLKEIMLSEEEYIEYITPKPNGHDTILYRKQKTIAFVYVQEKSLLETLYKHYNKKYPDMVQIINGDNKKESELYQNIINTSSINQNNKRSKDNTKLVLMTDIISAGNNILDETSYYFLGIANKDTSNIRQVLARFRKADSIKVDWINYYKNDDAYNVKAYTLEEIQNSLKTQQLIALESKKDATEGAFYKQYRQLDYIRNIQKITKYNDDIKFFTAEYTDDKYKLLNKAYAIFNTQCSYTDFNTILSEFYNVKVGQLDNNNSNLENTELKLDMSSKELKKAILVNAFQGKYDKRLADVGITKDIIRKVDKFSGNYRLAAVDFILKDKRNNALTILKLYRNTIEYKKFNSNPTEYVKNGKPFDKESDDFLVWDLLNKVIVKTAWYSKDDIDIILTNLKRILDYKGTLKQLHHALKLSFKSTKVTKEIQGKRIKATIFSETTKADLLHLINKDLAPYGILCNINDISTYLSL